MDKADIKEVLLNVKDIVESFLNIEMNLCSFDEHVCLYGTMDSYRFIATPVEGTVSLRITEAIQDRFSEYTWARCNDVNNLNVWDFVKDGQIIENLDNLRDLTDILHVLEVANGDIEESEEIAEEVEEKIEEAQDKIVARTIHEIVDELAEKGFNVYDVDDNWLFAIDEDQNKYEIELNKYFDGSYELVPENINKVKDASLADSRYQNKYGLFRFEDEEEYKNFDFQDDNVEDFADVIYRAEDKNNAVEKVFDVVDPREFAVVCIRFKFNDYRPLFVKACDTEEWEPCIFKKSLTEKSVDMKKDDILFTVIKRSEDGKYLAYEGANFSDGVKWVDDLDHAEAFDGDDDPQDILWEYVAGLEIPQEIQNIEDDLERADTISDWISDRVVDDYEVVNVKADHFYEVAK